MKSILYALAVLATGIIAASFSATDCKDLSWGTKTLYQPDTSDNQAAPAGYQPVFINYIGRHGARHLTSPDDVLLLKKMTDDAAALEALTDEGFRLREMTGRLLQIETEDSCGLLTAIGREEQAGIGRRMRQHYPQLLTPDAALTVVSTRQERTRQSAESFLAGMGMTNDPNISRIKSDSITLRFYEIAPAYRAFVRRKDWAVYTKDIDRSPQAAAINGRILHRFFRESFIRRMHAVVDTLANGKTEQVDTQKIVSALRGITAIKSAVAREAAQLGMRPEDIDIASLFSCEELEWMEYADAARDFLVKGPGTDLNGIQVRNAVPLLVDLLNTTEEAVKGSNRKAVLRFAHAETMSPLASLLEIEGAATATTDVAHYNKVWHPDRIISFSANMQWILYRPLSGSGDLLLKILYNEKPVSIPVATSRFPYYGWSDVRAFYLHKLHAMQVQPTDDMYRYLQQIR